MSAADRTIRVLIVDDQPLIRAGLAMLLAAEPDIEVVGEAGNGRAAIENARALRPDVVLMDVRMPHLDGVQATRAMVAEAFCAGPDRLLRVLILTTFHADETVFAALRAGASGFLLKDAAPRDLLAAVRAVADGDAWLDPAVAGALISAFAAAPTGRGTDPEAFAQLTTREREVLVLVAHGLSNAEIAGRLILGEATVKTHLSRVIMKLGVRDRAQAIVAAYQGGLVVPGQPAPAGDPRNGPPTGRTSRGDGMQ